ncbi:hypothetical protein AVEN_103060-1 [Araneus ventricosus]|uniref:Uncharacterized protein n=1 Tax=Araneus ventricosus TaxID=182803 RepID=A0A4Y2BAW8_ARAVE|nr:hypothetical protein AVEN_103060-1 [Araneus ventricosus]
MGVIIDKKRPSRGRISREVNTGFGMSHYRKNTREGRTTREASTQVSGWEYYRKTTVTEGRPGSFTGFGMGVNIGKRRSREEADARCFNTGWIGEPHYRKK